MRARGVKWVLALGWLLVACGDDGGTAEGTTGAAGSSSSSGEPIMAPTIIGEVDVAVACSEAGATRVGLRATRVGCVQPTPCTLPEVLRPIDGTEAACPPEGSPQTLRVELTQAGRYQVEAVTFAGETELSSVCYGFGGEAEVLVTDAEIDGDSVVVTAVLDGSPCA